MASWVDMAATASRKRLVESAKVVSLMHRCVKMTDTPTGRYRNAASGKAVDVDLFRTGGEAASENVEAYGGSLAVKLLLRFQKQARCVLSSATARSDSVKATRAALHHPHPLTIIE